MSSAERYFGLRLALWYATLFVLGAIGIAVLTYYVTASSLTERDREILEAKAGEYALTYGRGGLRALAQAVRVEQLTAPERLFVRVVDRGAEALVLSHPGGWDPSTLETASRRLSDGTLVQVGKSTETRLDLLARVRAALALVTLALVTIALTGGWLATQSALRPIERLTAAVSRIVATGRTDERVTVPEHADALKDLTLLFNAMLDRIEALVNGMRGTLDNVSHDLRTPLTRLRGAAELALGGASDTAQCREALADCLEEADRLLVMLNTLMDISEAESGVMPLQRAPLRLSEIAERAVELYRDVAEAKDLEIAMAVDDDPLVSGDRIRLEQAAANLLDNAVKYTPPGGRIHVEVGRDDARALLRVRDTGPGIPASEHERIWERLFRGDSSRAERGLGLGLSLVRAVIAAHGGAVGVSSEPGLGSTFTIALPLTGPSNPSRL
jgi:signal transduction histidine kinase